MKKHIFALTCAATLALAGCSGEDKPAEDSSAAAGEIVHLKVGASPVPHADILNYISENLAEDAGLELEVIEYSDYVLPNKNLDAGELDANYFQHIPYLEAEEEANGYDFEHGPGVHIEPFGVYSNKIESLEDLADGAKVSVVNDPSNQARALWLLEKEGVITLKEAENPTIYDIKDNPLNLQFLELEAPNLVRTLDDADIAIINGNFALEGGLVPSEDAIATESGEDNPYANVLAWNAGSDKEEAIKKLDDLLHSDEVASFITEKYPNGEVIPAKAK
ncbi:MAG: MetQ/NlpA family ABC transporter substrate-binding protein [Flaviflexus sp.]|nr:MetQ/NlpA family ABC transporter substrate-binding protein [Flaviflexus sp.]